MFPYSCNFPHMILGWKQWEENSNITRNSSRSDILTLLTFLRVDGKSAVLLRVRSSTKLAGRRGKEREKCQRGKKEER